MARASDPIDRFGRFLAQSEHSPLTIKNYPMFGVTRLRSPARAPENACFSRLCVGGDPSLGRKV